MKNPILYILIVLMISGSRFGINSYILYSFVLVIFVLEKCSLSRKPRNSICIPIFIISLFSICKFTQISTRSLLEVGLMMLGCLCFYGKNYIKLNIKTLNLFIGLSLIINIIYSGVDLHVSVGDLINSDVGFESPMFAFTLPFFFYYWLNRGKLGYAFGDFCLIVLSGKRIAVFAVIIIIFYHFFIQNNIKKEKIKVLFLSINGAYLVFSFLFALGFFDEIISDFIGVPVNKFTMGRFSLYEEVVQKVRIFDNFRWIYGIGLGNVEYILMDMDTGTTVLHNDILKIFLECGVILLILFFYLLYDLKAKWQWGYIFIWNILFMTDNTIIYVPVVFTLCLMIDSEYIAIHKSKAIYSN